MDFSNFELLLTDKPPRVQVIESAWSPGGEPFEIDLNVNKLVKEFDRLVERPNTTEEAVQKYGAKLFGLIFGNSVGTIFDRSMGIAASQGKVVRMRLRFEGPSMAQLPWELLYSKVERFLATNGRLTMCRFLQINQPEPLKINLPLKILVVMCHGPKGFPKLNQVEEASRIEKGLDNHREMNAVKTEFVNSAEYEQTFELLQNSDFHILHFIGHGEIVKGQSVVYFENGLPEGDSVDTARFADLAGACNSLRLVVLNACFTAREPSRKAFSSMASQLVAHGVPAVVAMQTPIEDVAAIGLAGTFYGNLAGEEPIDRVMTKVRQRMMIERETNKASFSIPVLYMQTPDGLVFSLADPDRGLMIRTSQQIEQLRVNGQFMAAWKELHKKLQNAISHVDAAYGLASNREGAPFARDIWVKVEEAFSDKLLQYAVEHARFIGRHYDEDEKGLYSEGWISRSAEMERSIRNSLNAADGRMAFDLRNQILAFYALLVKNMRLSNRELRNVHERNTALFTEISGLAQELREREGNIDLNWDKIDVSLQNIANSLARIDEWLAIHNLYDRLDARFGESVLGVIREPDMDFIFPSWFSLRDSIIEELLHEAAEVVHIGRPYIELEEGKLEGEDWVVDVKRSSNELDKALDDRNFVKSLEMIKSLDRQITRHYSLIDADLSNEVERLNQSGIELHSRVT